MNPCADPPPATRANLCFIVRNHRILLIRKKRGLGAGKINAPGGKVEPDETPVQAAIRETREEVGVTPIAPRQVGELFFRFRDGYRLECHVFRADDYTGEPHPTAEADPFWAELDAIPYDQMWADDRFWLPLLLAGERFRGFFEFDGDKMLSHRLERVGCTNSTPR